MAGQMPYLPMTSLETNPRGASDPLAALRHLFGMASAPVSSDPSYDAQTADEPGYQEWSAQRPDSYWNVGDDSYGATVAARTGIGPSPMPSNPALRRNNASVALMRKQLGMGHDDGGISQADLESAIHHQEDEGKRREQEAFTRDQGREQDAYERGRVRKSQGGLDDVTAFNRPGDTGMRREKLHDAEDLASTVPRVTGEYSLKRQALENSGDLEKQRAASQGLIDVAKAKGGAGGHMSSAMQLQVAEAANVVEGLQRLRTLKPSVDIGPVTGRTQSFLSHVPLVPTDKAFSDFKSETANLQNSLYHALSGAAVTPTEASRLQGQIPLETDKDTMWESKADALEKSLRGLNARRALINSGVPVDVVMQMHLDDLANHDAHTTIQNQQPGATNTDVEQILRGQ